MVKQEKIKLSAIIKTKNSEDYLCNSLESIKNLDEIIVLDEHSNDDTVEIIKEYKAKVIYIDKTNPTLAINQALEESSNEWVIVLEDKEIISKYLLNKINEYILKPKKNKDIVSFPIKYFYMDKEIKCLFKKENIKLFKKGTCTINSDFSIKKHKGKVFKFKKNDAILNFIESNISKNINSIIEKNRLYIKNNEIKNISVVIKPIKTFLKYFIFKGGFMDGKYGFMFSKMKFLECFILNIMALEKKLKGEKYDI